MWEYGKLHTVDGNFYFNGSEVKRNSYPMNDLIATLNVLGLDGWELVLKDKEDYLLRKEL